MDLGFGTWPGRAAAALLVAFFSTLVAGAHAEPSPAEKETARRLMTQGLARREAGDHAGASEAFEGAHRIMRVPTTGLALGTTLAALGRLNEARDRLLEVTRLAPEPGEPPVYATSREEAVSLAETLRVRIPTVELRVVGPPSGTVSRVTLDGEVIAPEVLAYPRATDPGTHRVRAESAGYLAAEHTVTLAEGERRVLELRLRPTADAVASAPAPTPAPAPAPGGAGQWAVPDPQPRAPGPSAPAPPPPDRSGPPEPETPDGAGISPVAWVGFGVGGAGLLIGAIAGGVAAGEKSDLDAQCQLACTQEDIDGVATVAHVSTAGFVLTGVGAAVGLVGLLALDGEPAADRGARVVPVIGPGLVGARGVF